MGRSASVRRFFPAGIAVAAFIAVSAFTRTALALRHETVAPGFGELAQVFAVGTLFDLVAAAYAVTPLLLWLALAPDRLARTRIYRVATLAWFFAACFAALFLAVAEWLFWDEFGSRFNFIAVDYLLYTHEVLGNVWQSYPVSRVLGAIALASAVAVVIFARPLWGWSGTPAGWRYRLAIAGVQLIAVAGLARFVDADFKNRFASDTSNDLAGNGLYEFFAANYRSELSFERHYAMLPLSEAMATVRRALGPAQWIERYPGDVERFVPRRGAEKRLNVILVSVESLGAEYVGAHGDHRGLTPNLDRLARDSLWFSSVYATGNRTVRGLEALALALPPTPGQSIVRRPHNDALFSLGSVFEDKGYGVTFAYGGYGYFDNMNAFFQANDYHVIDRADFPSARIGFANIWGVADEHLYEQVIEEIDRNKAARPGKPVFVHVMTTSNHRPYTYPGGRIDIPSGSGREGAVKYTDYAIGQLIEGARARPWFDDTVFVITADHGANARGTTQIPVDKYRIPLFIYAPKHIAAARVDRLMSQIDIAPTLLGLLDFDYYTKFFGRDVLHSPPETDRAFVANFQTLGYLHGDRYVVLQPKRRVEAFRVNGRREAAERVVDRAAEREAIAFYQIASHVFHNGLYRDEEQVPPGRR